jgi:hypothetical protein
MYLFEFFKRFGKKERFSLWYAGLFVTLCPNLEPISNV